MSMRPKADRFAHQLAFGRQRYKIALIQSSAKLRRHWEKFVGVEFDEGRKWLGPQDVDWIVRTVASQVVVDEYAASTRAA